MSARAHRAPRVKVVVGADLIGEAIPRDSSHCMIAEAVKAVVPDAKFVSVDLQTIRFTDPKKGLRYTYLTPRLAQVALVNFDQGRPPEPFSMELRNGQVTRHVVSSRLSVPVASSRSDDATSCGVDEPMTVAETIARLCDDASYEIWNKDYTDLEPDHPLRVALVAERMAASTLAIALLLLCRDQEAMDEWLELYR